MNFLPVNLRTLTQILAVASIAIATPAAQAGEAEFKAVLTQISEQGKASEFQTRKFTEYRHFPYRKKPTVVTGIIRQWENNGSSIEYPEKRVILISQGDKVVFRKIRKDGSFEDKLAPTENSQMSGLLNAILEADFPGLEQSFELGYANIEVSHIATLTPKNKKASDRLSKIVITLVNETLKEIDVFFGPKASIKIVPESDSYSNETLSDRDIDRYFNL